MLNKKFLILLLLFGIILSVGFLVYKNQVRLAKAGSAENVSGWAWSSNIGWVSFNSDSGGGPVSYGAHINSTGVLSGYAWSGNVGWISFNEADLAGCPSGTCRAWVDLATGNVSGWIRVLSAKDNPQAGGWDGWISLRGTNYSVGVDFDTKQFTGWAWAGDVIGWLNFNCNNPQAGGSCDTSDYKVETDFSFPPAPPFDLAIDQGDYCSYPLHPILSWQFQDPDPADIQGAYQVQVDDDSNLDDSPVADSCSPSPGTCSQGHASQSYSLPSPLNYNTTYWWRVRVWDNNGSQSQWSAVSSFTTSPHAWPRPDFSWLPQTPSKDEITQFCSTQQAPWCPNPGASRCFAVGGSEVPCSGETFLWTFPAQTDFTSPTSTAGSENPAVIFKKHRQKQNSQVARCR